MMLHSLDCARGVGLPGCRHTPHTQPSVSDNNSANTQQQIMRARENHIAWRVRECIRKWSDVLWWRVTNAHCSPISLVKAKHKRDSFWFVGFLYRYTVFSSLGSPAVLRMLIVILRDARQWQQQWTILRQLCGSRNLTFQCHGVSLFQQKSMQAKGTLGRERAAVHVQRESEANVEGICVYLYLLDVRVSKYKYVVHNWCLFVFLFIE